MLFLLQSVVLEDNIACKLCIKGVDTAYELLNQGFGRDLILYGLEEICKLLPQPLQKEECKYFIQNEYDQLMEWLESGYPSETLCTLMNACDYPHEPINSACDACTIGIQFIEDVISYGPTEDLLEMVLEYVCFVFPEGRWRDVCIDFADQEFENVISWVNAQFPPIYICTIIGACENPIDPKHSACAACELGFQFLYDVFDFDVNGGSKLIEEVLNYVCWVFPKDSDARSKCQLFIDQEYEHLVNYLEHEFPPHALCVLTNVCTPDIDPHYKTECEFCRIFYQFALDILDFEPSIKAIEHLLEQICKIFPGPMEKDCDIFMDKFYESVLKYLTEKLPAGVACEAMGVCEAN